MPSYHRDPAAPALNVPRKAGADALIARDELAALDLWPAVRPVVNAFLARPTGVVVS